MARYDEAAQALEASLSESDKARLQRFIEQTTENQPEGDNKEAIARYWQTRIRTLPEKLQQAVWDKTYMNDPARADDLAGTDPHALAHLVNTYTRFDPDVILATKAQFDPNDPEDIIGRAFSDRAAVVAAARASPIYYTLNRAAIGVDVQVDLNALSPTERVLAVENMTLEDMDKLYQGLGDSPAMRGVVRSVGELQSEFLARSYETYLQKPYINDLVNGALDASEKNGRFFRDAAFFGQSEPFRERYLTDPNHAKLAEIARAEAYFVMDAYPSFSNQPYARTVMLAAAEKNASYLHPRVSAPIDPALLTEMRAVTRQHIPLSYMNTIVVQAANNPSAVPNLRAELESIAPNLAADMNKNGLKGPVTVVNALNDMHNFPREIRFAPIKNFTSSDLFNLITDGRDGIYTSTYNNVYAQLTATMDREGKTFSQLLAEDPERRTAQLPSLMDGLSSFAKFPQFLSRLTIDDKMTLTDSIFDAISKEDGQNLVAAANYFNHLPPNDPALAHIEARILQGYTEATDPNMRDAYGILAGIYTGQAGHTPSPENREAFGQLSSNPRYEVPNRNVTPISELVDERGRNFQMHLFYNDEDGVTSYQNFRQQLRSQGFTATENQQDGYVHLQKSLNGRTINIYATIPEEAGPGGSDANDAAADKIRDIIHEQGGTISFLAHRGHSYHVDDSVPYMSPENKIVFLGACGGSEFIQKTVDKAPDAGIVATSGEGTKFVNEPIMADINNRILTSQVGVEWQQVSARIDRIPDPRADFYQTPNENMGALIYSRLVKLQDVPEGQPAPVANPELPAPATPAVPVADATPAADATTAAPDTTTTGAFGRAADPTNSTRVVEPVVPRPVTPEVVAGASPPPPAAVAAM